MKKTLNIIFFGELPSYIVMAGIGFLVTSLVMFCFEVKAGYDVKKIAKRHMICVLGLVIGMKLFGMLSVFLDMVFHNREINWIEILNSGIVFYGGLLGYYITRRIITRNDKNKKVYDILAFCFPMFSIFGRIGCLLAGCCYGKPSNSIIALPFYDESGQVVRRIPTQLIEALFDVILTAIFLILYIKKKGNNGRNVYFYFIFYAIIRFVIEFFRGDEIRGVYGFLSFSQIISILLVIYSLYSIFKLKRSEVNVSSDF